MAAPAARVAAVITDFPAYPTWVTAVSRVEILEQFDDGPNTGLAKVVRFHLDAGVVSDVYVLSYTYERGADGELSRIAWQLVEAQTQKDQHGSYTLQASANQTEVTYALSVELKIPMLGLFKRKAEKIIMDTALKELKKRVEAGG